MGMESLELRGRLNRHSIPAIYSWRTEDGITYEIDDQDVTVRWRGASNEPDNWGRMLATVERALFGEMLRTDQLAQVRWETRVIVGESGVGRVVGGGFTADAAIASPMGRLDQVPAISALDTSFELYAAVLGFEDGLEHLSRDDMRAAMQAFAVANEVIVHALRGKSHESDWVAAAEELGLDGEKFRRLYLSLQQARHADASHALGRLKDFGWDPLGVVYCRGLTGDLLRAYAATNPVTTGSLFEP